MIHKNNGAHRKGSVSLNYLFYVLQEISVLLSVVVVTPYISRILGAENIGVYSYTHSIASYTILFGTMGMALYGRREIAACGDSIEKRSIVFFNIICLRALSTLAAIAVYFVVFNLLGEYQLLFRISVLEILASAFEISWFFQGENRFHINSAHAAIFKLLYTASIFLFVKTPEDLDLYCICLAATTLLQNLSTWLWIPKSLKLPRLNQIKPFSILAPVFALFLPQIAIQVYQVMDKTMLYALTHSQAEAGYYEQGHKIINIATLLITARGVAVTPKLSAACSNGENEKIPGILKESFQFIWFVGAPLLVGLLTLSDVFVPWFFGEGYDSVAALMKVFAPISLIIGLSNILTVLYIAKKRTKEITIAAVSGAVINLIMNSILIPSLRSVGAALASVTAELIILCMWICFVRKDISWKIIFNGMPKKIAGAIAAFVPLVLLFAKRMPAGISFLTLGAAGVCAYVILLILMKDNYMLKLWKSVLNLIKIV